jgi:hypothetical protein
LLRFTCSAYPKGDCLADAVRSKPPQQGPHVPDRFAVPSNQNIPLVDASLSAWSLGVDAQNDGARSFLTVEWNGLKAKTKITARDITVSFELGRDTLDSIRRYHKNASTRSKHGHAHGLAGRIENNTTFGAFS